jgi:valyl-tRNA synthetase
MSSSAPESPAAPPSPAAPADAEIIPKDFDSAAVEERCRALWDETGIHRYDPAAAGRIFSVDTPPPYVSAAHLHVGHAMSYAQAEFVIRWHRMNGRNVFYPMGFDDNGLPTERYVEKTFGLNKRNTTRSAFRALCLEETQRGGAIYEKLWRALGLSVDWSLRYSTIDEHCRRSAQKSFLDLYRKGRIYRSEEPVLWDTEFETALAQADLDSLERKGKLHDVVFSGPEGQELIIATTRPELIPACVGMYCHPDDERYRAIVGKTAKVPLSGHEVPILADPDVDRAFGTGLMMVCTFGDGEDVRRWKRDRLATRTVVGKDGRMLEAAGAYKGKSIEECRANIVRDLEAAGLHRGFRMVDQNVSVSERSGIPVEFVTAPQWFIRVLDMKEELLRRSGQLRWNPGWMKARLDHWIEGLKYDWNISRQRFYGVPFPVWYCGCEGCDYVALAEEAALPVDPLEDACPLALCPNCGCRDWRGEPDVMDTWMTSSLTPLVNSNWAGSQGRTGTMDLHPMTVRVQAFEIIRTWLFYTVVKSHLHLDSLPWEEVMISGWGLNEQGKKISKRDLEKHSDPSGFNRYEPYAVIQRYGADALRYWAAGSHLGHDTRYNEKDVKAGRKLVVKLWNAARFVMMQLGTAWDPKAPRVPFAQRTPEDRWLLTELNKILPTVEKGFLGYDYAVAREATDRFFWQTYTDDYLEMVKDRFWNPGRYPESARESARCTLWESLRTVLALYAPFLPFVTEELYQRIFRAHEASASLHVSGWPAFEADRSADVPEMQVVGAVLRAVRAQRTELRISQTKQLQSIAIDLAGATDEDAALLRSLERTLQAVGRTQELRFGAADASGAAAAKDCELPGVKVAILPMAEGAGAGGDARVERE